MSGKIFSHRMQVFCFPPLPAVAKMPPETPFLGVPCSSRINNCEGTHFVLQWRKARKSHFTGKNPSNQGNTPLDPGHSLQSVCCCFFSDKSWENHHPHTAPLCSALYVVLSFSWDSLCSISLSTAPN